MIPKLTNKQKEIALIAIAVGALLYLWFVKDTNVPSTKHITTVVEEHKKEVKNLEEQIKEIRKKTDIGIPKVQSLDIDPLVDFFNGWLLSRQENRQRDRNDY